MPRRWLAFLMTPSLALLSGACASGSAADRYVSTGSSNGQTSQDAQRALRSPQVMNGSATGSVIGLAASSLASRFGVARIDLAEGDARKLQFVSQGCVLDIYLYPPEAGASPVATHIEARQRQGGAEADREGCIRDVELAANAR